MKPSATYEEDAHEALGVASRQTVLKTAGPAFATAHTRPLELGPRPAQSRLVPSHTSP
jgi:hypothetical protein